MVSIAHIPPDRNMVIYTDSARSVVYSLQTEPNLLLNEHVFAACRSLVHPDSGFQSMQQNGIKKQLQDW